MSPTKTICIVGITGNQGGSVAQRFLQDPSYHIRGITRNASSPAAQKLAAQGIEIIQADLEDVPSLTNAFKGANLIFSVTNYWEPFYRPDCRAKATEQGITCREYAYHVERQQGKNIADAVAQTVDTLDENGFIASTLSNGRKASGGRYTELYHFDSKAEIFPEYVQETYPALAAKMSCVQTGYFMSSHKLVPEAFFKAVEDGSFEMGFPTAPHVQNPQLDVNADMGNFVYAVSKMGPGKSYMAEGTTCSWPEYIALWGRLNSVPVTFRETSLEEFIERSTDEDTGKEVGDMFVYSTDPGYDGGDKGLLKAADIRKAGIDCPMTSLEEFILKEDWTHVLQKGKTGQ